MIDPETLHISDDWVAARSHVASSAEVFRDYTPTTGEHIASPELTAYFFSLQGAVEKQGRMDYRSYAEQMWDQLINPGDRGEGFEHFQHTLVSSLHAIDMKDMVYPDLTENIGGLLEQYGDTIGSVGIWSTGDVTATAYQEAKIAQSGIIEGFLGSFATRDIATEFARQNTFYIVRDNKFTGLADYIESKLEPNQDEPCKVVIIEDSIKNFTKAQTALDEQLGEGQAIVVPVWFVGSREGQNAIKKAGSGTPEEQQTFAKQCEELNFITSCEELLDTERFGEIAKDAHVMFDFDGVIGDNIAMRVAQARVTFNSLIEGYMVSSGLDADTAAHHIETAFIHTR